MSRRNDFIAAAACLVLLAVSILPYAELRSARARVWTIGTRHTLEQRLPWRLDETRKQASPEETFAIFADTALDDATQPVDLPNLSPEHQELWKENLFVLDEELESARDLMLDAIASRPGWDHTRMLLGQLEYARLRRRGRVAEPSEVARWDVPLTAALAAAPENDFAYTFLAGAYVETWGLLPDSVSPRVPAVLRKALRDSAFLARSVPALAALGGAEAVLGILPRDAQKLSQAFRALAASKAPLPLVAEVHALYREREEDERVTGLDRLVERSRLADVPGLVTESNAYLAAHPPRELDTPRSRKAMARVVELWPAYVTVPWGGDGRTELIRYFLDGRTSEVDVTALSHLADGLANVPPEIRARLFALSGERYRLDRLRDSEEASGTLSWTGAFVAGARRALTLGKLEEAAEELRLVSSGARGECEVLLVRRDLAEAQAATSVRDSLSAELVKASPEIHLPAAWSASGSLSLCIDPAREDAARRVARIEIAPAEEALVAWGWDGGRSSFQVVSGPTVIEVSLEGLSGRRALFFETLAGPRVEPGETRIVSVEAAQAP